MFQIIVLITIYNPTGVTIAKDFLSLIINFFFANSTDPGEMPYHLGSSLFAKVPLKEFPDYKKFFSKHFENYWATKALDNSSDAWF